MVGTRHRWCLWHVLANFGKNLGKYARYKDFKVGLSAAIYESVSKEEFDSSWCCVIEEFELGDEEWLTGT